MNGYSNNMTLLLEKIEWRLGTQQLNLPDYLGKDKWADIIIKDTLVTFSRYYPHQVRYILHQGVTPYKNGWYYLDEDIIGDNKILGVKDIDWEKFNGNGVAQNVVSGYGMYDVANGYYNTDDILMLQMRADSLSLYKSI